ncbi:unnamed protein product [Periconia digitata]|uniref:Secreted protein n=1 Tax=Periconia digitata TaxID=1303443 RepID=A0A9W4XKQ5_9PLEO|nr:unnamed protein product [Periconia digitata]
MPRIRLQVALRAALLSLIATLFFAAPEGPCAVSIYVGNFCQLGAWLPSHWSISVAVLPSSRATGGRPISPTRLLNVGIAPWAKGQQSSLSSFLWG